MASPSKRICWDSCAWIALIQKEKIIDARTGAVEDRYAACRAIIDLTERTRKIELVVSALALAEVCKHPGVSSTPDDKIQEYFEHEYILTIPVDVLVGTTARRLMLAGHARLKPPDAVHLATAIVANVDELHTFDGPLLDLDGLLTKSDGTPLRICKPGGGAAPLPLDQAADERENNDGND